MPGLVERTGESRNKRGGLGPVPFLVGTDLVVAVGEMGVCVCACVNG